MKHLAENRKARHNYLILETFEGGLSLLGKEVKSIREGGAKLQGAYLKVLQNQLWLLGATIAPYSKAAPSDGYDPIRTRKLLVRKKELHYLAGKTQEKGLTLVPISLYPSGRRIKLSFGLARGKQAHDKREALKKRDALREIRHSGGMRPSTINNRLSTKRLYRHSSLIIKS